MGVLFRIVLKYKWEPKFQSHTRNSEHSVL
jgi:hypothetical protein